MQFQKNVPLAQYTTFGIGGIADEFAIVNSSEEIIEAVSYAQKNNFEFFLLGSGANILIGDKGFRGLVIKNEARHYSIDNSILTAESGAVIGDLITITAEKGLSGLEHFAGIPSTLGGALWQNLHFLSPDRTKTVFIGDIVQNARVMNPEETLHGQELKTKEVTKDFFNFSYDYSILHESKDIVLSATLRLTKEDPTIIQQRITANLAWRKEKHPENAIHSSAGSVFKKIENHGAGRLIEQVGLKGYQIGGAQISPKHANFIVNTGGATAKDVQDLIFLVQAKVKKELSLDMQPEISFVGEF